MAFALALAACPDVVVGGVTTKSIVRLSLVFEVVVVPVPVVVPVEPEPAVDVLDALPIVIVPEQSGFTV